MLTHLGSESLLLVSIGCNAVLTRVAWHATTRPSILVHFVDSRFQQDATTIPGINKPDNVFDSWQATQKVKLHILNHPDFLTQPANFPGTS